MSCPNIPSLQPISNEAARTALTNVLGSNSCTTSLTNEFDASANVDVFEGKGDGSISNDTYISSAGCEDVALQAQAYQQLHTDLACMVQTTRQETSISSKFNQNITLSFIDCSDIGPINLFQQVKSSGVHVSEFSAETIGLMVQKSKDTLDTISNSKNESKTGWGALPGATKSLQTMDSVIATIKSGTTINDIIQTSLTTYIFDQNVTTNFIRVRGLKSLTIDQNMSSQIASTDMTSNIFRAVFDQFDETELKASLGLSNTNTKQGLFEGLATLVSAWMSAWIIILVVIGAVVCLVLRFVFKSNSNGKTGFFRGISSIYHTHPNIDKTIIVGLVVGLVVMLIMTILYATQSNNAASAGICAGLLTVDFVLLVVYLVYRTRAKNYKLL
jgi:hypothetical protein